MFKSTIRISFILLACFVLSSRFSFAGLAEIETALIQEDYTSVEKLSQEIVASSTSKDIQNQASYYLGLSQIRLNKLKEAHETFQNLIDQKINTKLRDKAYLGLFDSYFIEENYAQALTTAQKLLRVSPRSELLSLIYLKLARANLKLAQWSQARDYLTKIVEHYPNSLEVHVAKQLLDEKQYFAVQVGAFMDHVLAEKLATELNHKNEYAYIVETVDRDNRKFFRVRVGQLSTIKEAQTLKSRLASLGYPTQIYP